MLSIRINKIVHIFTSRLMASSESSITSSSSDSSLILAHILDGVGRLHLEVDGLAGQGEEAHILIGLSGTQGGYR